MKSKPKKINDNVKKSDLSPKSSESRD